MSSIRRASRDDLEPVFRLASELATSFDVDRERFSRSFKHCISDESSLVLVAEEGKRIVGYLLGYDHYAFFANGRVTRTEEIYVMPEYRGSGVGRALMNECEAWAREREATLSMVVTRRASAFYKSLGYEESATYFKKTITESPEQSPERG